MTYSIKTTYLPPLNDVHLKKALTVLDVMNFTPEEREAYEGHLKWLWIEANTVKKAENKGREKGRKEGREEGREIGKAEGIQIGEAKGKVEAMKTVAKMLLKKNQPIKEIMEITGLSMEELDLQ